ncbi:ankyrin repeat domain-containing protein [Pokkaliibacter sp. CJK22405]|uniref:ankyrin repeat domain-containing protein n=1 Tax=Pokkaliibacter sp. CJK22405 TaxID=3384615 RepID=UPI003984D395
MKPLKRFKWTLTALLVMVIGAGITAGHSLYQEPPATLLIKANPEHSFWPQTWAASAVLWLMPPREADIDKLNARAAAQEFTLLPNRTLANAILEHFLDHGLKINAHNTAGGSQMTALHYAALSDDPEAVRMLLHLGADTKAVDKDGKTPLQLVDQAAELNPNKDFSKVQTLLKDWQGEDATAG